MKNANYQNVAALARSLSHEERERLARELLATDQPPELRLFAPAPHSVAWLKAERGHAVLATGTGPAEADIPAGADAIAGMWADLRESRP